MKNTTKKIFSRLRRCFPPPIQRWIRRRYYLRVVQEYAESAWEWSSVIKPLVPSGGQVLDIGANVGYLSRIFAGWVGPRGRVVSIEPIPDTFDSLQHSMRKLYPGVVTTLPCCMSDQPGQVTMAVPTYRDGGENYYESHIIRTGSAEPLSHRTYSVVATTIDAETERLSLRPDFIKVDVEGHELSVIRGGEKTVTGHNPPLLIEVAGSPDDPSGSANELFHLLKKWGYDPFVLDQGCLRMRKTGDVAVDYLFLAEKSPIHENVKQ